MPRQAPRLLMVSGRRRPCRIASGIKAGRDAVFGFLGRFGTKPEAIEEIAGKCGFGGTGRMVQTESTDDECRIIPQGFVRQFKGCPDVIASRAAVGLRHIRTPQFGPGQLGCAGAQPSYILVAEQSLPRGMGDHVKVGEKHPALDNQSAEFAGCVFFNSSSRSVVAAYAASALSVMVPAFSANITPNRSRKTLIALGMRCSFMMFQWMAATRWQEGLAQAAVQEA